MRNLLNLFFCFVVMSTFVACGGGSDGAAAPEFVPNDFAGKSLYYVDDSAYQLGVFDGDGIVHASDRVTKGSPSVNSEAASWAIVKGQLLITYSGETVGYKLINNDVSGRYYNVDKIDSNGMVERVKFYYDKNTALSQVQAYFNVDKSDSNGGNFSGAVVNTYPLSRIMLNLLEPSSNSFDVSGVIEGRPVTGSGTVTRGGLQLGEFEGAAAKFNTTRGTFSLNVDGENVSLNTVNYNWYSLNSKPVGSAGEEYAVVVGNSFIPEIVRVNDAATIFTARRYSDSSKSLPLGTLTLSYIVEADSAIVAKLTLVFLERNINNVITQTKTEQYRITTTGAVVRTKQTLNGQNSELTLTYN